ncbi:MAG: peptidylprolyl isomerase, partial [Clostridia bacterium]|nr:peptidylprolyl isomerase [Clostridia bacterium]
DPTVDVDTMAQADLDKWKTETDELKSEEEMKAAAEKAYQEQLDAYDEMYGLEDFKERLTQSAQETRAFDLVNEKYTSDITVGADEIKTEFDRLVAEQKEEYDAGLAGFGAAWQASKAAELNEPVIAAKKAELQAEWEEKKAADPTVDVDKEVEKALEAWKTGDGYYELMAEDPSQILVFTPAGYRSVKHILIALPDDVKSDIAAKRSEAAAEEEDDDNYDALVKKADEMRDTALAALKEKADEALARARAGEDFATLMTEYGLDPIFENEPAKTLGLPYCSETSGQTEEYKKAALALAKQGDVSEPVGSDAGYYIIQYAIEIKPGTAKQEDVNDAIHDSLMDAAKIKAMEDKFTAWETEYNVKRFPKLIEKFKINRGQAAEAPQQ